MELLAGGEGRRVLTVGNRKHRHDTQYPLRLFLLLLLDLLFLVLGLRSLVLDSRIGTAGTRGLRSTRKAEPYGY